MRFTIIRRDNFPVTAILKEQLRSLDIRFKLHESGEIELPDDVSSAKLDKLALLLKKYSIEVLDDEKSQVVQKIRNILIELVHDNKPQLMTISYYLSERMGLSYGYLSSLFAIHTHYSIEKYIILLRIERAKEMIIEGRLTLKQISAILNYSSVQHFSRQFKKTTGLTISSFKRIIELKRTANT
ncbi:AraC family transcriptional regulator [Flavobacterium sp.]|uniref:helix-turn-helix domain-containing protein n=1 Tax=Flavobacterium sp. TaxID=239 RepID=UPI00122AB8AC|nr:AraC family transcriptional regulator [Flavobacterium sp.]RZJ70522.1 MAG: AraC family transcriptional regulator [Flavobacterium sp.]